MDDPGMIFAKNRIKMKNGTWKGWDITVMIKHLKANAFFFCYRQNKLYMITFLIPSLLSS